MSVTSGYFNSLRTTHDRQYNADQMSEYHKGLVSDGVCKYYRDALEVVPGDEGMAVKVMPGRAYIDAKWCDNDSALTLEISGASSTLNRYTLVVARLDRVGRIITIDTVDGEAASSAEKPELTRNSLIYEICLAEIYVPAGTTTISDTNITDTRGDDLVCGWVRGYAVYQDDAELTSRNITVGYDYPRPQNIYDPTSPYYENFPFTINDTFGSLTSEERCALFDISRLNLRDGEVVVGATKWNVSLLDPDHSDERFTGWNINTFQFIERDERDSDGVLHHLLVPYIDIHIYERFDEQNPTSRIRPVVGVIYKVVKVNGNSGGGGDYSALVNQPKINGHTLIGDLTAEQLGISGANISVEQILTSGTEIAEIDIDGVATPIYAPQGGGGTDDYTDLTNKPQINNVELSGNKTAAQLGLVAAESGKGLSSNDYTNADKSKLGGIESGAEKNVQPDWSESDTTSDAYIKNKPTIPTLVQPDWNETSSSADDYIKNKPTLGTASSRAVASGIVSGSTDLATAGQVYSYVNQMITQALNASY